MNGFDRSQAAYDNAEPAKDYELCDFCGAAYNADDILQDEQGRNQCASCFTHLSNVPPITDGDEVMEAYRSITKAFGQGTL